MVELLLWAPENAVDWVSDALMNELEALAVSIEDADADTPQEHALFGEPGMPVAQPAWQRSAIKALFNTQETAAEAAALLLAQEGSEGVEVQHITQVPEQDWVRTTQAQFTPVEITPSFWIVPSWHEAPPAATKIIRLDPGLAFGTGTHPTTRMCLRWIARHAHLANSWHRVLDYGCGSGILAIGAALYGGRGIDAVDIDPAAVLATQANAQANAVTLNAGMPEACAGQYPLVLANILATPLKLLAPLLCGHLERMGDLVLAGILERQASELQEAYAPWLTLTVADQEDGWILMTGQRI
jgi:ribosomal protein L11 methyltransferase